MELTIQPKKRQKRSIREPEGVAGSTCTSTCTQQSFAGRRKRASKGKEISSKNIKLRLSQDSSDLSASSIDEQENTVRKKPRNHENAGQSAQDLQGLDRLSRIEHEVAEAKTTLVGLEKKMAWIEVATDELLRRALPYVQASNYPRVEKVV